MDEELRGKVHQVVKDSLDEAEAIWDEVGAEVLIEFSADEVRAKTAALARPSRIPGHQFVIDGEPKVDDFIAMAVDQRDSTNHLLMAISGRTSTVSEQQRSFYETSALLPAMAMLIDHYRGKTTEYLGDGVLGLFRVEKLDPKSAIYDAHNAAQACLTACAQIVSAELAVRYKLPALSIGIGLARSKTIVTPVGYPSFRQPKAIGKCVYYATKLSKGRDQIIVDKVLRFSWPQEEHGALWFIQTKVKDVEGYIITQKA